MDVRWGDDSSVESEEGQDDYVAAGVGHVYAFPFVLAGHEIRTYGDFLHAHHDMYDAFADIIGDYAFEYWSDITQGLLNLHSPDDMDAASFEMSLHLSNMNLGQLDTEQLTPDAIDHPQAAISDADAAEFQRAVEDLTLDVFDTSPNDVTVHVPDTTHRAPVPIRQSANIPPLSPLIPESTIVCLVLSPANQPMQDLQLQEDWSDTLGSMLEDFPNELIDQCLDTATVMSSRSNTRPRKYGTVSLRFADGQMVNIGSHGHELDKEVAFRWTSTDYRTALAELMSAPGGEGLTCATPSMMLHQIISACLSNSLDSYQSIIVEKDNIDILLSTRFREFPFDITSSSGIWDKRLIGDKPQGKWRTQSAISKYDVAKAIVMTTSDDDVRSLVLRAVANCLALEYPSYYRRVEVNLPYDLQLQTQIYDTLNMLPKKRVEELGQMAYDASIELGLSHAREENIYLQGKTWTDKRDEMLSGVKSLRGRNNVALPPIATSEIVGLPHDTFSILVCGHQFQAGPQTIQGRNAGPKTHIDSQKPFLHAFPACGIVPEEDSREIANLILDTPVTAYGRTHRGPADGYNGCGSQFAEVAGDIYARSSMAQLAEVRADIARAVDKLPAPQKGQWQQVYVYKGKVCAWYSLRDAVNSPNGFRVDWFAVSSYPVLGSIQVQTTEGKFVHLWPRQKFRSQDMKLMRVGPRRLKGILFSMLEKSRATSASLKSVYHAWEKLATTLITSTYASGKLYLTGRYLSSTMGSPSSPFHEMVKKLVPPRNFADIYYLEVLERALKDWTVKTQYRGTCPLLRLPRAYAQLESYWMVWVPDEFADSNKNFALCVMSLHDEARYISETMAQRCGNLESQLTLLSQPEVTHQDMVASLQQTCSLDEKGMLGWSWIGSLASGHALRLRSDPALWDRLYGRGTRARTLADHLTVRHSARLDKNKKLQKGTVAELMIDSGTDAFLSTITATYRFLYVSRPDFFNHPKNGEHKEREISITDPDSRIVLSDAELICGTYGVTTGVDFLKDPGKNKKFFDRAERVLGVGGGIQSSDATRYGPNMSNLAIAIMLLYLGVLSMHLRWASVVYARMAYRRMVISKEIMPELHKMAGHADTRSSATDTIVWLDSMPKAGTDDTSDLVWYCTSHHMGQGMSHHSSSLLHAGGICVCVDAVNRITIRVAGVRMQVDTWILVTSDDSTLLAAPKAFDQEEVASRRMRQKAARIFLTLVRAARKCGLTMVSVKPNLVKEMISATKGEFNSQDTGIGISCPILGFRELVTLIVHPSAPALIGDYLNAHACSRDIAFAGQGLVTGAYIHALFIDMIEERWGINQGERKMLHSALVIPLPLVKGASDTELASSPASWLPPPIRASLYRLAVDHNCEAEDLDPNVRDTIFSPLMHVKVSMSRQHKKAITKIKTLIARLEASGMVHQAHLLSSTLRSTLSSARSRNLGRIANRIRGRKVSPKSFLKHEFPRGTMIETTLNWIAVLNQKVSKMRPSAEDIAYANRLAGFVRVANTGKAAFPLPPRLRRSYPPRAAKPKYRTGTYGSTPFGMHALERSGTVVVLQMTHTEREVIQAHLAMKRHRMFSEHVTYGGSFISSWAEMRGVHIVSLDISGDTTYQMNQHIRYGDFSDRAIAFLSEIQRTYPDMPVLALHRYDGVRGLWHGVYKSHPYTVYDTIDYEKFAESGRNHFHQIVGPGQAAVCVFQGFDDDPDFMTSEPNSAEIRNYQEGHWTMPMPDVVQSVEDYNMRFPAVKSATYATPIRIDGQRCLFYTAPTIATLPREEPLPRQVGYRRAGVITALSTGGYWNSAIRGVCFRAWLRGHACQNTIWTGGVIGWRLSATSFPEYTLPPAPPSNVKDIIIGTGIDSPDQLSQFNPDFFATGAKFVSQSNTETFACAIRVGAEYREYILAANGGQRFFAHNGQSRFVDTMLPEIPVQSDMGQIEAVNAIRDMYLNNTVMDPW